MAGWIKLWDKLKEWRWKKDPNMMALWVHILLYAEWEGTHAGELVTSLRALAEGTGLSLQSIRTCLKKLSASGELQMGVTQLPTQGSTHGIAQRATKITICNYGCYQGRGKVTNTRTNTAANTAANTTTFIYSEDNTDGAHAPAHAENRLEERREKFKSEVFSFSDRYYESMLEDFFNYWSESTRDGKKMRCEKQDTWETSRRLATWDKKNVDRGGRTARKEQRKDPTPADVLGEEYVKWMKTAQGQQFGELFK